MKTQIQDLLKKFTYRVEWSEEDQVFIAHALEMLSVKAHADTQEGALTEVKIPLEIALEGMIEDGEKLPEPLSVHKYRGQFPVRTTPEKHKEIAIRAAESGVSINQYVISKLG